MNLLNWGEEGIDYVVEDEENEIINYPDGITADNVGYSLNLGWELPNQFIAYKWSGSILNYGIKCKTLMHQLKTLKQLVLLLIIVNTRIRLY